MINYYFIANKDRIIKLNDKLCNITILGLGMLIIYKIYLT